MKLEDYRPMMERCSNCLNCKWIPFDKVKNARFGENCPAVCYYNFNTYSARGRFQMAQSILDGRTEYTPSVTDIIHACTACGACDVSCKICRFNLEPLEHNIALKASAVQQGRTVEPQKAIMENLREQNTMIRGRKKQNRMDWTKELGLVDVFQEEADVVIFAGCKYSYDERLQEYAKAGIRILQKASLTVGTLGAGDNCCGGRAWQMGFEEEFKAQAERNMNAFRSAGVKQIVTFCADCFHAFKRLYPAQGCEVECLHITECLERLISEGKIQFTKPIDLKVTYHDPCHLGRQGEPFEPWNGKEKKIYNQVQIWEPRRPRYSGIQGVYDAPRNILQAIPGVQLVEMDRIREYSWCCGAGGGCNETQKDFSDWTAAERMTEAVSTGADALVTACPWCNDNLTGKQAEDGTVMRVYDLLELIALAM